MNEDIRKLGLDTIEPYTLSSSTYLYNIDPPEMLIEDTQPRGTITGLTASPGVGKTWFALEMSRAVATGTKFLGAFDTTQGAVLFVGSDSSEHDYARQWRRLTLREWTSYLPGEDISAGASNPDDNPLESNVKFLIQSSFMLDNLDAIRKLVATSNAFEWGEPHEQIVGYEHYDNDLGPVSIPIVEVRRNRGFQLIIFDTWSKLTTINQNDNSEVEAAFRMARFITENTGAACVILHHNAARSENNSGRGFRGATAGLGALDNHIQLDPSDKEPYIVQASFEKFRGIKPAPFYYAMNVNDEESASLEHRATKEIEKTNIEDELTDAIIGFLRTPGIRGQWMTIHQIVSALHPNFTLLWPEEKKFNRAVYTRIADEKRKIQPRILQEGGGNRGRKAMYMATEPGSDDANSQST